MRDFQNAYQLNSDPRVLAMVAYCLALDGRVRQASDLGEEAIRRGATSAAARNNLAFALTELAKFDKAIGILDNLLKTDSGMQAALYNRAVARFRETQGKTPPVPDRRCVTDITAAVESGLSSAELHFFAATVYATFSGEDTELAKRATHHISEAIKLGKDPIVCQDNTTFRTYLGGMPDFKIACATRPDVEPGKPLRLRLVQPPLP